MPNFDNNILITNIKDLMTQNRTSQEELARILNTTQSSISKLLKPNSNITIEQIFKIADHFNVTIDSLCSLPIQNTTNISISEDDKFAATIESLAHIFKSNFIYTKTLKHTEYCYKQRYNIFENDDRYYPDEAENTYNAIFFPNYFTLNYNFTNGDEQDEYNDCLAENGNLHTYNSEINKHLKKLIFFLEGYNNNTLSKEQYFAGIDSILSEIISK